MALSDGELRWTPADGTIIHAPFYAGTVRVGELDPLDATITVLGDEAFVGVGVAAHFTIILDHGRRVIVEP